MDKPSPFAGKNDTNNLLLIMLIENIIFSGAEGFLTFEEGQISASVEIGLHGVPSDAFIIILQDPDGGAKLGSTVKTTITILGEQGLKF